ncbi:MAG: hypothetical protein M1827_005862 [Pycnora praestabilis]|nr:MAG: hypothetical protein M1827_005862 [Pycnora praestabilis]
MAAGKEAVSFDEIIRAGLLLTNRRKNEALAKEIFGKGRRASAPGAGIGGRKTPLGPASLASRVGIAKDTATSQRSISTAPKPQANIEGQWGHDLHHVNNPKASRVSQLPRKNSAARITRDNRLYAALQSDPTNNGISNQVNIRGATNGISIRGTAGPFVVTASNFAPGTTAADIEATLLPIGGEMTSCRIIVAQPTVIAEIVFVEKEGAENVIAMLNNQKADGRLLNVYMKQGPATPASPPVRVTPTGPRVPRADLTMNSLSKQSDRRRPEADLQDGSYGFDQRDSNRGVGRANGQRGLYSDNLVPRGRGFR